MSNFIRTRWHSTQMFEYGLAFYLSFEPWQAFVFKRLYDEACKLNENLSGVFFRLARRPDAKACFKTAKHSGRSDSHDAVAQFEFVGVLIF